MSRSRSRSRSRFEDTTASSSSLVSGSFPVIPTVPSHHGNFEPAIGASTQQHSQAFAATAYHGLAYNCPTMVRPMDPTALMMTLMGQHAFQPYAPMPVQEARTEFEIFIADSIIGKIIGRGGSNLDRIRRKSGADVVVEKEKLPGDLRRIKLAGRRSAVEGAHVLFDLSVQDVQAGRRPGALQQIMTPCLPGMTTKKIHVEQQTSIGGLIGRNGDTINLIREQAKVPVEILQHSLSGGVYATVHIGPGIPVHVESAALMVAGKLEEGRCQPNLPRKNFLGENLWATDTPWLGAFNSLAAPTPTYPTF